MLEIAVMIKQDQMTPYREADDQVSNEKSLNGNWFSQNFGNCGKKYEKEQQNFNVVRSMP